MLPDIRAAFAAFAAAIALLMVAFAAVAAFRVAQEGRFASVQSDLAQRGRAVPPQTGQRIVVIETPGPHIAPPPPLPAVEIRSVPVGGPLAEPAPERSEADRAAAKQERARKLAAAKRARQMRLARQRKAAAARRAAQARANAKQAATSPFNTGFGRQGPGSFGTANPGFGNSGFGSTFGKQ